MQNIIIPETVLQTLPLFQNLGTESFFGETKSFKDGETRAQGEGEVPKAMLLTWLVPAGVRVLVQSF